MEVLIGVFIFLLGVCIGSFLNVAILRHNTGFSLGGRSFCFSCGTPLSWRELIPLFSYIAQRGRCASCGSGIALQYPLVEFLSGCLFLLIYLTQDFIVSVPSVLSFMGFAVVWSLLLAIGVYDNKHKIIPDRFVYTFAGLAFCSLFFEVTQRGIVALFPSVWEVLAGPLVAAPFALLWLLSRGRWIGLGDAKLALGFGWIAGIIGGFSALLFGVWAGALFGVISIGISRMATWEQLSLFGGTSRLTMKSEIPFGPFLILGFLLVHLFGFDIFALLSVIV